MKRHTHTLMFSDRFDEEHGYTYTHQHDGRDEGHDHQYTKRVHTLTWEATKYRGEWDGPRLGDGT